MGVPRNRRLPAANVVEEAMNYKAELVAAGKLMLEKKLTVKMLLQE